MLRIGLFVLTNIAILTVAGIVFSLLGLDQHFQQSGGLAFMLVICALFGMGGAFISLLLSKRMAKRAMRVQIIDNPRTAEEKWLVQTVTELSHSAGIKTPEIGIFPANESNAFATGWNKNDALVAVSIGLLQRFDRDEARAVLAHEIGHVANGDMITLTLIQGVLNTFVMFFARIIGQFVDRVIFKNERGGGIGFFVATIFAQIVLGFLASMIVMAFSRYREYRADAAGASLASRGAMIRALQRLQAEVKAGAPTPMPKGMQAFGISGGWHQHMSRLFASHPPLDARIAALQNAHG